MSVSDTYRHLKAAIETLPAVDVHTHLGLRGQRQARTLADLVAYHWLQTELLRAGASVTRREAAENPDAYMEKAAPVFGAIRSTSNHYCFIGMLRDLYGFDGRTLDAGNWRRADEAVRAHAADPGWLDHVLDRARIRRLPVDVDSGKPDESGRYWLYAYAEAAMAPINRRRLQAVCGGEGATLPADADALAAAVAARVRDAVVRLGVRTLHVWPQEPWAYRAHAPAEITPLVRRVGEGAELAPDEQQRLASFCADAVAAEAGRHRLTIQLFHGMARFDKDDEVPPVASVWDPYFLHGLTTFAPRHSDTHFDLFLGTRIPSHEAASAARVLPNVAVSGGWWHGFTPSTLGAFFRDRLEMLPNTAWNAFYSDGYLVEWIYAKLLLTRNALSLALAQMMDEGYLGGDDALEIAGRVLAGNAEAIYRL
jgi:hypothetical protein